MIDSHLNAATLILLLISPDFLASDYCYDIEMRRALERHDRGEARVIPIILHPCDWRGAPFGHLQGILNGTTVFRAFADVDTSGKLRPLAGLLALRE